MYPAKAKAAVLDPEPANECLAVLRSLTSVHDDPSQISVFATAGGASPPVAKAAVAVPAEAT